jgi:chromosomal replication initiator protein
MADWDYEIFWKEAMNQIRLELGEQEFSMWFTNLKYTNASENEITIAVPSPFYRDQFMPRYNGLVENKIKELTGKNLSIILEAIPYSLKETPPEQPETPKTDNKTEAVSIPAGKKKERHPQLREDYTFDRYVIGDNNRMPANAAMAIARNPGTAYNPFFIYGGVGLGKTHLIQAIGNYIYEHSNNKIIYITAENFLNEFIQALSESKMTNENKMPAFKNKFRYVDVLLIDDIHFIQDKPGIQEELFHTFNTIYDANKQLVFTCDRPASELKKVTERLKSRFERGLNMDLYPPDFETRCAILKSKVEARGIDIPDDVISLVSKNVSTNIRDLESALTKLIAYAELVGKPITVEIAQQQLKDVFASPRQANMSIEIIQRVAAEHYSLSITDLTRRKKSKNIVLPRQIAMYIAQKITEYSTTEIGQAFGGRDHTTVMHACQKIEELIRSDPNLDLTIQNLIRTIKEYSVKS